jgi:anaerobic magnesium-protoporphyrin IX monomethyl ester cyclase
MSRVDTVHEELFRLMKSSGCHQISLGIESADEQILKNIRKNIDLDQARAAIALAKKVGIDVKVFIMLGNPGETEESLKKTLHFVLETEPTAVILSIATPYPGTEFYRWARDNGYLKIKN